MVVSNTRNILSSWTAYAVNVLVGFFLSPFVVHQLGDMSYGLWTFMIGITGYMGLLDLGIRSAVTRYVAKYNEKKDFKSLNGLCSTAFVFYVLAGSLACGIGLVLSRFLPDIINGIETIKDEAQFACIIVSVEVAIILCFNVFGGIIVGLKRFDISQGIGIFVGLIKAGGAVFVLLRGYGIVGLACTALCSTMLGYLLQTLFAFKLLKSLRISIKTISRDHARQLFGFGILSFFIHISAQIIYYTDSTVIGVFLEAADITYYMIAGNLLLYAIQFLTTIGMVLFPSVSGLHAREDMEGLRDILIHGTRLTILLAVPIYYSFLVVGQNFIDLWMGEQYGSISAGVLYILTFAQLINLTQIMAISILSGMYKHKFIAGCMLGEAIVNIVLSVILVHIYGIYGVAMGTTIPFLVTRLIIVPRYLSNLMNIRLADYYRNTIISGFLNGLTFLIPILVLNWYLTVDTWSRLILTILSSLVIYGLYVYNWGMGEKERSQILKFLRA